MNSYLYTDKGIVAPLGMGRVALRFYGSGDGNKCLDAQQFGDGQMGVMGCDYNNPNQQWYYHPVLGRLYNANTDKCLDGRGDKWSMEGCNSSRTEQRILMYLEGLRSAHAGNCLDIANTNRYSTCNLNGHQKITFINT